MKTPRNSRPLIIVLEKPRANCGLAASKLWRTTKFRKAFYHVTLSTGYKNAFTFCLAGSDMRHFAATPWKIATQAPWKKIRPKYHTIP